ADMVPMDRQMGYYEATRTHVQVILDLLLELNRRLDHQKQQKQQFPFADIGKMALTILNDPDTLKTTRNQFQYIMVDEYQDTNDLQEALLTKIGNRNVFMVGDVKQSIYRFRNANSEIFNRKFLTYQPYESVEDKHQTKIILVENFRSRQEVLAAINDIFKHLMKKELGGITYNHEQALNFGQQLYQSLKTSSMNYDLEMVRYEKTEKDTEFNEPELIAQDILRKIEQGVEVADLATQSKRKASFKDFTILIDRKSNFEAYIKTFNQYGIPLEVFAERDLSDSDFYRVLKNIMVLMVHHHGEDMVKGFEQAYISVLRSFIYQTKDPDLYAFMHGKKSFKETALFTLLKTYIPLAQQLDLATWMQQLFQALKLEQALLTLPDLPSNLARLEGWLKHVQHLSGLGYTLKDYLNFLKQAQSLDVDLTIQASKQSDDAVQLMTIHKSKGLEFPFVYYPGLTKGFNMVETKGYYQFSQLYGIQLPYPEAVYVRPIFADLILQEEQDAIIAEQIRLWYVALTRAKEKIILILESSQPKTIVDLERARCFADFMQIYLQQQVNISIQNEVGQFPISLPTLPSVNKVIKDASVKFEFHPQPFTVITPKRASKLLPDQVDEAALAYGTYLHECLFLLDFKTLDVRFIPNEKDRHLIAKIVAMPIFQQWQREAMDNKITVLKEYAYLDPSTNQTSMIDLLVIQGDKVTILDYKTNDIDDPLYETQVITYATYMKQQGFHVQSLWLLSLVQGKLKKVNFSQN
ncbi:MAG: UvrD-helicase domain-containing protein, partial [Bacilli bacterium]